MTTPFYVSPEQVMKDRADYARKGIARGRSLVALEYTDGIVIVAENPSRTLFKISEVYDRIAFAGVGKEVGNERLCARLVGGCCDRFARTLCYCLCESYCIIDAVP